MLDKQYYVYSLVSKKYGTFYIGITSNLVERIYAHKQKYVDGFTKKYGVDKLGPVDNEFIYCKKRRISENLSKFSSNTTQYSSQIWINSSKIPVFFATTNSLSTGPSLL